MDFPTFVVDENDPIKWVFSCIHDEYKIRPKIKKYLLKDDANKVLVENKNKLNLNLWKHWNKYLSFLDTKSYNFFKHYLITKTV